MWYSLLLLDYKPIQHVTVPNTVGNCNTVVSIIIYYNTITRGKKKKRTSKKNVDGRCTSSHENKTFGSRSVAKQKGMVFGFRKTATAVTRRER